MKNSIIITAVCIIIWGWGNISLAQNQIGETTGIWAIIFENNNQEEMWGHSIVMNEISYDIIKTHLVLAGKDTKIHEYDSETLTTIKGLEELTKQDVIEILSIATNKQEALAKYLADCDQYLQKWDGISAYLRQDMQILKQDMQSCINEKSVSDKAYFDAIERYDQKTMETSLTNSITYENCATENRIKYNAKASITQKIVFYLGLLQKKYDVLFAKQDIVTKNFEIFRDKILPDLNEIDTLLQQYKF